MTSREAFVTTLAVLFAAHNRELLPPAVEAYWLALSDLTEKEFAAATKQALQESKFLPVPAELRAFAGRLKVEARGALAWEAVRSAIDRVDYTGSVDFGPLVNAVCRNLGGWTRLCALSLPQLVWARKDFERVFAMLAVTDPAKLHGAFLRGESDYVTRITIAGEVTAQPEIASVVSDVVRRLADLKTSD